MHCSPHLLKMSPTMGATAPTRNFEKYCKSCQRHAFEQQHQPQATRPPTYHLSVLESGNLTL